MKVLPCIVFMISSPVILAVEFTLHGQLPPELFQHLNSQEENTELLLNLPPSQLLFLARQGLKQLAGSNSMGNNPHDDLVAYYEDYGFKFLLGATAVSFLGERLDLTPKELNSLFALIRRQNKGVSYKDLLRFAWAETNIYGCDRGKVQTTLSNLRRKLRKYLDLPDDFIQTHGAGNLQGDVPGFSLDLATISDLTNKGNAQHGNL